MPFHAETSAGAAAPSADWTAICNKEEKRGVGIVEIGTGEQVKSRTYRSEAFDEKHSGNKRNSNPDCPTHLQGWDCDHLGGMNGIWPVPSFGRSLCCHHDFKPLIGPTSPSERDLEGCQTAHSIAS
jgi:hypothetical protein